MKEKIKRIVPDSIIYFRRLMINRIHKHYTFKMRKKFINKSYYKVFKKNINWENPVTYNEKLSVSKLMCATKIKSDLTDKIKVRDWVKDKIGEEHLIPLIGTYDDFDEIDFEKLPNKFVIKMNHDCGSVSVVNDKSKINKKKLEKKYNFHKKFNYAYKWFEMHYENIEPKILIEKNMGSAITDYKFLCFDGVPYTCRLDFDRFGEHTRNIYDLDWNLLDANKGNYKNNPNKIDKPKNFDEMVEIVKKLCDGFDQVRVDLYDIDGKIYFGEMTFTNGRGEEPFHPESKDEEIGKLWNFKIDK